MAAPSGFAPSLAPGLVDQPASGTPRTGRIWRRTRPASPERPVADRLLNEVERGMQRRAGVVRVGLAALLFLAVTWASRHLPPTEVATFRQVEAAQVALVAFGLTGLAVYVLASRGIATRVLPYATVAVDAVLILANLLYNHFAAGIPGNFTFLFPVVWLVPIALAGNAMYYRPGLQAFATALYLAGLSAISLLAGYQPPSERLQALRAMDFSLAGPPNVIRLLMVLAVGFVLVLAAVQGRRMLERAVRETALRMSLTRYLPRELAPILSEDAFEDLRAGRRIPVALLFVDIRGSTALGARMDPAALARFITAFRRRVGRAASQHGGVVDKFIGDGALLVFGVPKPDPSDPARALACARTLVRLMERWNEKRRFDPPVEIGIGLHFGEVFCGVVGEESRLEFTVLGDPVNVAARLEKATRNFGGPILASAGLVEAAGEGGEGWREVSREPLPGVGRALSILQPLPAAERAGIGVSAAPAAA